MVAELLSWMPESRRERVLREWAINEYREEYDHEKKDES